MWVSTNRGYCCGHVSLTAYPCHLNRKLPGISFEKKDYIEPDTICQILYWGFFANKTYFTLLRAYPRGAHVCYCCSVVSDSVTPWTAAHQASLSISNSWRLLKLMSIELLMPSNHSHPLLPPSPIQVLTRPNPA